MIYENAILYVPAGCKQAYVEAEGWKNFKHIEEMDSSAVLDFFMEEKGREVNIQSVYDHYTSLQIMVRYY